MRILHETRVNDRPGYICVCDCGNEFKIRRTDYERGKVKGCGCRLRKHNLRNHPLYGVWRQMIQRCCNPDHIAYADYGGRGIDVHTEWLNLQMFVSDIETSIGVRPPRHQLDRTDNNKGYEPGNVRWATQKQQCRNRRNNLHITVNDVTKCVSEWAEETGIHIQTLLWRIRNNTPVDKLLAQPRKRKHAIH